VRSGAADTKAWAPVVHSPAHSRPTNTHLKTLNQKTKPADIAPQR
jgi:hypothetical protein